MYVRSIHYVVYFCNITLLTNILNFTPSFIFSSWTAIANTNQNFLISSFFVRFFWSPAECLLWPCTYYTLIIPQPSSNNQSALIHQMSTFHWPIRPIHVFHSYFEQIRLNAQVLRYTCILIYILSARNRVYNSNALKVSSNWVCQFQCLLLESRLYPKVEENVDTLWAFR